MTNTINSTFRTASGLLAGLTIAAVGFVGTRGSSETTADAADYVVWRKTDCCNITDDDSDAADFLAWHVPTRP